jgi:hypothetical protein
VWLTYDFLEIMQHPRHAVWARTDSLPSQIPGIEQSGKKTSAALKHKGFAHRAYGPFYILIESCYSSAQPFGGAFAIQIQCGDKRVGT